MRRVARFPLLIALAGAALACALPAAAEPYPDRSAWLLGLELGWAKFAMDDVNDAIGAINQEYGEDILSDINGGVEFSAFVGRRFSPAITAGLKFTRLDGSTDHPDPTGALEINTGANVWGGYVHYVPPVDAGMAWGAGLDLGVVSTTGEINLAIPAEGVETGDFGGSAPAAAGYLILDFPGTRTVSFQGHVGYRYAKIDDVTLAGGPSDAVLDHSGFFARAGFRLHP
ncbi:MAG: hypothetical protein IH621_09340 [Krumholzibacteria bacterium]|nr:hypothetical protein [Candidatus Krumholzibacteria bacterium]